MALIAYNVTNSPVTIASTSVVLPAAAVGASRGEGIDVSDSLRPDATVDPVNGIAGGRSAANYTSIRAQVPSSFVLEYSGGPPTWLLGSAADDLPAYSLAPGVAAVGQGYEVGHETFLAPAAAAVTLATIDDNQTSVSPSGQMGAARTVRVVFHALWAGGNVVVKGVNSAGMVVSETFLAGTGVTREGAVAFVSLIQVTATGGGAGSHATTVQTSTRLGVSGGAVDAFLKLAVGGVNEAIPAQTASQGTFTTTTALNGIVNVEIWYARTR